MISYFERDALLPIYRIKRKIHVIICGFSLKAVVLLRGSSVVSDDDLSLRACLGVCIISMLEYSLWISVWGYKYYFSARKPERNSL